MFLLFLSLRVAGIVDLGIQTDEVHWRARSLEVIKRLKEGNYSEATTHLGQPGLPPAVIMAVGGILADKLGFIGHKIGNISIDHLHAARFACAFASSLIVFPILILGSRLLGEKGAILATLLLAFAPHHVGLSHMAHLDSTMSLFVVTSALFYFLSQVESRVDYKIYAGLFWGLAIATKPTSACLVFGFLLFNLMRICVKKISISNIMQVSDLWAVTAGHVLFALIYTRLWFHESDYYVRLKIESSLADYAFIFGSSLNSPLIVCLLILAFLSSFYFDFKKKRTFSFLPTLVIFLCLTLCAFPAVVENIIRYWTWAFGLSGHSHHAYGVVKKPPPFGYVGIILRDLSPIAHIGLIGGSMLSFRNMLRFKDDKHISLFSIVLIFVIWTIVLSVSSKQTIRYILPVYSLSFFLSSYFYKRFIIFIAKRIAFLSQLRKEVILYIFLFTPLVAYYYNYYPYQMMYENIFLERMLYGDDFDRQSYLINSNQVVDYISKNYNTNQKVYVLGDLGVMKLSYLITNIDHEKPKLTPPTKINWGHLVVKFEAQDEAFKSYEPIDGWANQDLLYQTKFDDFPSISLYKINSPDLSRDVNFGLGDFFKTSGIVFGPKISSFVPGHKTCPNQEKCLVFNSSKTDKAADIFGVNPLIQKGKYEFSVNLYLDKNVSKLSKSVMQLKVGGCSRDFTISDFSETRDFQTVKMQCEFTEDLFRQIKLHWYGAHNIVISNISIRQIQRN